MKQVVPFAISSRSCSSLDLTCISSVALNLIAGPVASRPAGCTLEDGLFTLNPRAKKEEEPKETEPNADTVLMTIPNCFFPVRRTVVSQQLPAEAFHQRIILREAPSSYGIDDGAALSLRSKPQTAFVLLSAAIAQINAGVLTLVPANMDLVLTLRKFRCHKEGQCYGVRLHA